MKIINLSKFKVVLLIVLFSTACFIRSYNFVKRINFGPEQGISLLVSANYIGEKLSLLGQKYFRTTSYGQDLHAAPIFNYSLVPLEIIFKFNPIPITAFFLLLNLLTGVVIFYIVFKMKNFSVALFSTILFLFNSYMIYHSMFIWILNYFPLFGVLLIYLLFLFNKDNKSYYPFLIGILCGIGFGFDYTFLFTAIVCLMALLFISRKKINNFLIFVAGGILGNSPMVIFDLKHQFYNTKTLWQYFLDTLKNPKQNGIAYYHLFPFWPLFALLGGIILAWIFKKNKAAALFITALYIFLNLSSPLISFNSAVGMGAGMNVSIWEEAAKVIAQDNPNNFNISEVLDFDSRAYPLRYILSYQYNLKPQGITKYANLDALYVFAPKNYDFQKAISWEINVYRPFKIYKISTFGNYAVYKLMKK